jgi:hypothetical protein
MRPFTSMNVAAVVLLAGIWPALSQDVTNLNVDPSSRIFAAASTAKQQCINACRARYRDCRHLNQVPSFECRGIYQDCTRYTCTGLGPG